MKALRNIMPDKEEYISPSAGEALKKSAADPVERIRKGAVEGLGKRVKGFTSREVKTTYEIDPEGQKRIKSEVVTCKSNPPDLPSIIFALTNLDSVNWKVKPAGDAAMPGNDSHIDLSSLSEEALRNLLEYFPEE